MKILKYPENRQVTCECGAVLAYEFEDIRWEGPERNPLSGQYIWCPCCKRAVVTKAGSWY